MAKAALKSKLPALDLPLEDYQVEGIAHLFRRPASGLLMVPGTGKTLTLLTAFYALKRRGLVDTLLVLAPLNPAYEVWPAEVAKWGFPLKVSVLHGPRKSQLAQEPADIYVLNYDGLEWFSKQWPLLRHGKRWWLTADESTKLKHTNTRRFKLLKPMLGDFVRRTVLTGTPAPNGLLDLFGQAYVVDLGEALGRYVTQYRREYFYQTGYGGYTWLPQEDAEERIYAALDGIFYHVSDKVLGLKPPVYNPLWVTLDPKSRGFYEKLEREFVAQLGRIKLTAVNAGVLTQKLRQVANGAVYDATGKSHAIHDAKIEVISDLVEQLQGNPLMVGYEFTQDSKRLAKLLGGTPVVNGKTKRKEAKALFAELNAGRLPVLLCQTSAVAHGLNLQEACHTMALLGLPWDLEAYAQFVRRTHRKGQRRLVTVHQVLARDTIDEPMLEVMGAKGATQDRLLVAIKRRYLK